MYHISALKIFFFKEIGKNFIQRRVNNENRNHENKFKKVTIN